MARYYAVRIVPASGGFGEYEPTIYGGDYDRTIKGAIARATAGEHDPERHVKYLLGRDDERLALEWGSDEDIRGLIHNEPERVYVVETDYGLQHVGVCSVETR